MKAQCLGISMALFVAACSSDSDNGAGNNIDSENDTGNDIVDDTGGDDVGDFDTGSGIVDDTSDDAGSDSDTESNTGSNVVDDSSSDAGIDADTGSDIVDDAGSDTGGELGSDTGSDTVSIDPTDVPVICTMGSETDTDEDGLSDAYEMQRGTSIILADTDGDGMSDCEEVTNGGFDPLIADLPGVSIDVVDAPNIEIYVADTETGKTVLSSGASYTLGQSSSYSRSDTEATSATIEASTRIYSEAEVTAGTGGFGGSAKSGIESNVSASVTKETSTNVTSTAAQESRKEHTRLQEALNSRTRVMSGGKLQTNLLVTNTSNLEFNLSGVEIIAKVRTVDGSRTVFKPVATLRFEPEGGTKHLANGGSIEKLVSSEEPSLPLLKELMGNPSGLLFTVANYNMKGIGSADLDWPDVSQKVSSLTAQVVIDYGDYLFNGGENVERYMVATNVARDPLGDPIGISIADVMKDILEIPYSTKSQTVYDADNQPAGARHVLESVRTVVADSDYRQGFWYVFSNSESLDDPTVDFDDIILKARDRITMVYMRDTDGDELTDREEYLFGTDATDKDSDGDLLTDFKEIKEGWSVVLNGQASQVHSDPLSPDADEDNLSDYVEHDIGTDPNNADTDGDERNDDVDPNPVGAEQISNNVTIEGPGRSDGFGVTVDARGQIAAPSGKDLLSVTIDWGDGSAVQELISSVSSQGFPQGSDQCHSDDSCKLVNTLHRYVHGDYTVNITARAQGIEPEIRTLQLVLPARFEADLGQFTTEEGWTEQLHTRELVDVNGDDRVDILGFGPDGVWVALAEGAGFVVAELATSEFATDDSDGAFDKSYWQMSLGDFNNDKLPDIVFFAGDEVAGMVGDYIGPGAYVALNDGAGKFFEATRWTTDFGSDKYENFGDYPRLVDDFNGDGSDDLIGFHYDGVRISVSTGSSFDNQPRGTGVVLDYFGLGAGGWNETTPRRTADINGDGFADIVGFGSNVLLTYLNCLGPGPLPEGESCLSNGSTVSFERTGSLTGAMTGDRGYDVTRHPRLVIDIDSDGDDDVIAFANYGAYFAYSDGSKLVWNSGSSLHLGSPHFGFEDGWLMSKHPRFFADTSGDGYLDIVGIGQASKTDSVSGVLYATNNGGSDAGVLFGPQDESPLPLWINDFDASKPVPGSNSGLWDETIYPRRVGDVNGDGRTDVVAFGEGSVIVEFAAGL